MKKTFLSGLVVTAAFTLLPTQAEAQIISGVRCTADSLATNELAEKRVEWARRCGLRMNVGNTAAGFASPTVAGMTEYKESGFRWEPGEEGQGAYSGHDRDYRVNENFVWAIYLSGPTYQSLDAQGYYQWRRDSWRKRGRTLYPTFGNKPSLADAGNKQLFPNPYDEHDCALYELVNGQMERTTGPAYMNGYCESACYTPEQEILFSDGYVPILDALNDLREDLVTLAPDSTLEDIKLQQNRTHSYIRETRDAMHNVYVIRTQSGGELRVTHEHPVINGEGRIVQAQTLKVGQELMKADGLSDRIVDIQKTQHFGKVYNLSPATTDLVSNILVAQGFLVGSVRYQNDDVSYINRLILYRSMPRNILP